MTINNGRPILIVGYGSIGRRHLRNLKALGHKNFVLYRTGESTLPDDEILGIPVEHDFEKALSYSPIATIIANPTALHIPIALAAAKAGSHLFVEKPISHNMEGVEVLQRLVRRKKLIVQVGFQFRFNEKLIAIKKQIESNSIGEIVSAEAYWGEYLPDWHPWEDYRKSYSARRELGGGVLLTLCHPFDYLRWLLGDVSEVSAIEARRGRLEIDVEDSASVLLKFTSKAMGNVHLNFIEKPQNHTLKIIGQNGILAWNSSSAPDRNEMFIDEMKHFLSCIENKAKPLCTLDDGIKALRIVLAAKESIKKKRLIKL